jgi:hypothetical protein
MFVVADLATAPDGHLAVSDGTTRLQAFEPLARAVDVRLESPTALGTLNSASVPFLGHVLGLPDSFDWKLSLTGPSGSQDLATGSGPVVPASLLNSFDPASLSDGVYKLRLEAYKSGAATVADERWASRGLLRYAGKFDAGTAACPLAVGDDGRVYAAAQGLLKVYSAPFPI